MPEQYDTAPEVIRDLAFGATHPSQMEPGYVYSWLTNGQVHKIDLTGDQYREFPQRKQGTVTVANVGSFAWYWDKHAGPQSEAYADLDRGTFTGVINAHGGPADDTGWQDHRIILQLQQSLPWKTWLRFDRAYLSQQDFAEHIEDNARDVTGTKVTAADLLEIAQSFQANTKVKFSSGKRLATGETQFTYTEDIEAKAGNRGEIVIPSQFELAIRPYEDCAPKPVRARFRYRLADGQLRLGYFLDDPARIARDACDEIAGKLAAECGVTVMHGQPAR